MPPDVSRDGLLDELAESFVERLRNGELPSLTEYIRQYPALEQEIRELFPAMAMVENVHFGEDLTGTRVAHAISGDRLPFSEVGDYRILREVGRGGMGIVYEAEQKSLGRRVALKVLPGPTLLDQKYLKRFHREAKAAARLQHPNIVPVFAVGEHQGTHYFAMQFIQGQGLDEVLTELRRLRASDGAAGMATGEENHSRSIALSLVATDSPVAGASCDGAAAVSGEASHMQAVQEDDSHGKARSASNSSSATLPGNSSSSGHSSGDYPFIQSVSRIGIQAAEALHYAHEHGVLHRDVKPSNLLLDLQGNVWVTDFGLAKDEEGDNLTHTGDLVGTVRYMAPERFRGWCDPRADVYGLGLTLYELLTLRPAFDGSNRGALMSQVMQREPPAPRTIDRQIPRDLETIVLKSIAKESSQRYPSAGEFSEDLRRFLEGKPILARRTSAREQLWLWTRRNPFVATLAAVVLLLLSLGLLSASGAALHFNRVANERQRLLEETQRARQTAWEQLFKANLHKAEALRSTQRIGQRLESLRGLSEAAKLLKVLDKSTDDVQRLRTAAINSMALVDLEPLQTWRRDLSTQSDSPEHLEPHKALQRDLPARWDPAFTQYVRRTEAAELVVYRADGQRLVKLPERISTVTIQRFSRHGKYLSVFYRNDGLCDVFEIPSGRRLHAFRTCGGYAADSLDFSPDGETVAILSTDGEVGLYPLGASDPETVIATKVRAHKIRFSPDGRQVALGCRLTGGRSEIQIWSLETQQQAVLCRYPADTGYVHALAWSPDGNSLAAATVGSRPIVIWDAKTGAKRSELPGHTNSVTEIGYAPGGRLLASYSWDGTVRLWDANAGKQTLKIEAAGFQMCAERPEIAIWGLGGDELITYKIIQPEEFYLTAGDIAVFPDHLPGIQGTICYVSSKSGNGVQIQRTLEGPVLAELPLKGFARVRVRREDSSLFTGSQEGIDCWPIDFDEESNRLRVGPPQRISAAKMYHDAFDVSRDGSVIAWVDADRKRARIVHRGQPDQPQTASHAQVAWLSVSPDGRYVVTGAWHGPGFKVWDTGTGKLLRDLMPKTWNVAPYFTPDGRWLVARAPNRYLFWKIEATECEQWEFSQRLRRQRQDLRGPAEATSTGSLLATGFGLDRVRLSDPVSGQPLATFGAAHAETSLGHLRLCPDGHYVQATYGDVTEFWDLHAVRQRLRKMDLDWSKEPIPDDPKGNDSLKIEVLSR